MSLRLIVACTLGLGLSAAYAQTPPSVPPPPTGATVVFAGNAALGVVPVVKALPLPSCDGTSWSGMVDGMRNGLVRIGTSNWYQSAGACGLKFFLYNHEASLTTFAAFILRDGVTRFGGMPYVQGES